MPSLSPSEREGVQDGPWGHTLPVSLKGAQTPRGRAQWKHSLVPGSKTSQTGLQAEPTFRAGDSDKVPVGVILSDLANRLSVRKNYGKPLKFNLCTSTSSLLKDTHTQQAPRSFF